MKSFMAWSKKIRIYLLKYRYYYPICMMLSFCVAMWQETVSTNAGGENNEDEADVPMAQRRRFTRVEMARVLMERNQYKVSVFPLNRPENSLTDHVTYSRRRRSPRRERRVHSRYVIVFRTSIIIAKEINNNSCTSHSSRLNRGCLGQSMDGWPSVTYRVSVFREAW